MRNATGSVTEPSSRGATPIAPILAESRTIEMVRRLGDLASTLAARHFHPRLSVGFAEVVCNECLRSADAARELPHAESCVVGSVRTVIGELARYDLLAEKLVAAFRQSHIPDERSAADDAAVAEGCPGGDPDSASPEAAPERVIEYGDCSAGVLA